MGLIIAGPDYSLNRVSYLKQESAVVHGTYEIAIPDSSEQIGYGICVLLPGRIMGPGRHATAWLSSKNQTEGSMASGTSKKIELKLVGIARASLEELLLDYQDFLRQRNLPIWQKEHPKAHAVRKLCYRKDRSHRTYRTYIEGSSPDVAANAVICVIHQTNFLLDRQLRQLEQQFLETNLIRSVFVAVLLT